MRGNRPRRTNRKGAYQPINEINVTPFVDVILVLLIVFMISAPLLTVGVQVDLPKTRASGLREKTEPMILTITAKKELYIQESPVRISQLVSKLNAVTKQNFGATVYIRADQKISYGYVMEVMGRINGAGYTKVSLVSSSTQKSIKKK
ncbi:ExbD/TolR family protein [Alphaproteobacteria bacterium]|nr:ExbD/TolR family protein [Alphaproteobacteria bacterium]